MPNSRTIQIYIESTPLLDNYLSGIGHTLYSLIKAIEGITDSGAVRITLVAPFDKMDKLKLRTRDMRVNYKAIPLPAKVLYGLMKYNLVPPLDLYLGKGIYVFPNYRNWRLARSKAITYIYDLAFRVFPGYVSPPNQRFLMSNMPKWLRQTDIVATVSNNTKRDIIKYYNYPSTQIEIVPCGVDQDDFYPRSQEEISIVKERYDIPSAYMIFLSTIEPRKNIGALLAAYKQLSNTLQERYALVLIGASGWLNEGVVTEIHNLQALGKNIIWPQTYVPDHDLPALLSGAELLVHPAFYEGFGIAPLQAMACGTPVLVADNSSLPEVVGDAGLYFETGSIASLTEKIKFALNNPKDMHNLTKLGRRRVQNFTWERAGVKLLSLITLLSESSMGVNE